MAIVTFNNIPATEKAAIYRQISNKTGIPVFADEKDWSVVQSLSVKKVNNVSLKLTDQFIVLRYIFE